MASITIPLQPFSIPDVVLLSGYYNKPSIPLKDLDVHVLDELCREFRAAVFKKAGKQDHQKTVR